MLIRRKNKRPVRGEARAEILLRKAGLEEGAGRGPGEKQKFMRYLRGRFLDVKDEREESG